MPNGRSGSLFLEKTEFANWLRSRDDQEIIGLSLPATAVSVAMAIEMLASFPIERIAVEEQDARSYIVHLHHPLDIDPPEIEKWILIKPGSPLFEELRRRHERQGKWGAGSL